MHIISTKDLLINEDIREKELRVIASDGAQLGIMSRVDAQAKADREGLDLVLISPAAKPPVAKIIDYGKFRFEQTKREKDARKNQKISEVKEIQLSLNIDTNDFNTKANQAIKFLKNGDKVKARIRFKGREMTHINLGEELMKKFMAYCAEYGASEKPAILEGKNYVIVLSPKPVVPVKKTKTAEEQQNAPEENVEN